MNLDQYKWYKRKYFIKINCAIIMAIFIVILLLMGFPIVSNADSVLPENTMYLDDFLSTIGLSFTESNIYNTDNVDISGFPEDFNEFRCNAADPKANWDFYDHDLSNGELLIDSRLLTKTLVRYNPNNVNATVSVDLTEDAVGYFLQSTPNTTFFNLLIFTYDIPTEIDVANNGIYFFYYFDSYIGNNRSISALNLSYNSVSGYNDVYVIGRDVASNNNSLNISGTSQQAFLGERNSNNKYDETLFYYKPSAYHGAIATDQSFYTTSPLERTGSSSTQQSVSVEDSGTHERTSQIYGEPHYLVSNSSGSSSDNTYPDGSGGTDKNNLYMRTADWQFNIPKYWGNVTSATVQPQYENSWGSGSILFYGLLNDYQKDNSENFNLDFKFHIWCSGHYFSDVNSDINGNFYGSFDYTDQVSLDNFINNNNSCSFSVDDIFEYSQNSSNLSFNDFLDSQVKGHNSINNWNWYISCDAVLSAGTDISGHIVEKYNFISQVSQEDSNTITTNNDPYIPDDPNEYPPNTDNNNAPSNTDGYSKNGININNNPVITINNSNNNNSSAMNEVNNGNGNPFNILIDKLFGSGTVSEGSIGGSTQNQLLTTTGASRWLAVMGDSMTWVPVTLWAEIEIFLFITLGILVVAFILRIVLDFL